jgi:NAD(P)H-quinone oxidoreductase subunit 5
MPATLSNLALLAPAGLALAALLPVNAPGTRPTQRLLITRLATMVSLLLAVLAAGLTAAFGPTTGALLGAGSFGLSVRLDVISCSMFLLVAFVGVIVVQYSRNYMDGDARQGAFMSGLCLTLAAVMLLVLAGNLVQLVAAWMATSLSLHRMLVFYGERHAARMAARKKFIVARLGDLCLIGASAALFRAFGSTDITTILAHAHNLPPGATTLMVKMAALLIGMAALLKSAQFPSHGWLPEVMDTPTPVSALLHAGIINAGGFLMIRFADVMLLSSPTLHFIALIGGFTALFAGVVMLTQTSVKGSLAWSTVAQMGFMTLQCGLGAFAIALLPVMISLVLALGLYSAIGWIFGAFAGGHAAVLTLGAILVLGISLLMIPTMHGVIIIPLLRRMLLAAAACTTAYFLLETAAVRLTAATLPSIPAPDSVGLLIMGLAIVSFAAVTLLQSMAPRWIHHRAWRLARVHLANGLYVNACFNRLIGAQRYKQRVVANHPASSRNHA